MLVNITSATSIAGSEKCVFAIHTTCWIKEKERCSFLFGKLQTVIISMSFGSTPFTLAVHLPKPSRKTLVSFFLFFFLFGFSF